MNKQWIGERKKWTIMKKKNNETDWMNNLVERKKWTKKET